MHTVYLPSPIYKAVPVFYLIAGAIFVTNGSFFVIIGACSIAQGLHILKERLAWS